MTWIPKLLCAAALTALLVAPAPSARAENPGPASAAPGAAHLAPPGPDAPEAEREAYWRRRAQEARDRVAAARERVAESEEEYSRMRHRQRKRGEPRAEITDARTSAHAELEAALRYLEEELPEEARRAGALPGWLRE
jgi:hypothetical protein